MQENNNSGASRTNRNRLTATKDIKKDDWVTTVGEIEQLWHAAEVRKI